MAGLKVRDLWVIVHRWLGLVMTIFLVIVGITGSLLAFYSELDGLLSPHLQVVSERDMPETDLYILRERAAALDSQARADFIPLHRVQGHSVVFGLVPKVNPLTGKGYEIKNTEVFFDPYSGELLGQRYWGAASLAPESLMPFLYRFHYSLALPEFMGPTGNYLLGITALLWSIDCFIGLYLTFPTRGTKSPNAKRRNWWQKWKPAWLVKVSAGAFRMNFDIHRASGLWVWAMLFVFAWSSVAFNLGEVYVPVTKAIFGSARDLDTPKLPQPMESPKLSWQDARQIGRALMEVKSHEFGFTVEYEDSLSLDREHGTYAYAVRSSADVGSGGNCWVTFNADTGDFSTFSWSGNETTNDTVTRWMVLLHMAHVFGLPMKIFVCLMGFVITALCVTGVYIWWKKRKARAIQRARVVA